MKFSGIILALLISVQVMGQKYLPMEHFGVEDGLSFRNVTFLLKDSEGFMWFGTKGGGLNRYDGVEWKVYLPIEGDSTSIATNNIWWIAEDEHKNLLIEARTAKHPYKYSYYNRKTGDFNLVQFKGFTEEISYILEPVRTKAGKLIALAYTNQFQPATENQKALPKYLLFEYQGSGVFKLRDELVTIGKKREDHPNFSNSERFWYYSNEFYILLDIDQRTVTRYIAGDDARKDIHFDASGEFWFPNLNTDRPELFDKIDLPSHIPMENWQRLRTDNKKNLWLEEMNGRVFKYDFKRKEIDPNGEFSTAYFSTGKAFEDQDGTIWIPGKFGIDKIRRAPQYFENYLHGRFEFDNSRKTVKPKPKVKGVAIYPLIETTTEDILILTAYNKLYTINPNVNIEPEPNLNEYPYELIGYEGNVRQVPFLETAIDLFPASNGNMWISTDIIHHYNTSSKKLTAYPFPKDFPKFKPTAHGIKMNNGQIDDAGKIWYIFRDEHLYSFDTLTKEYDVFEEQSFPRGIIGKGKDYFWICTDSTLTRFDTKQQTIKEYPLPDLNLDANQLSLLAVVPHRDKIWLGTRKGLLMFDPKTEQFTRYTTKDGLAHDIIYSIIAHEDNLWMGTHYGLCRFNLVTKEIRNFYETDGLSHNEFNRSASLKASDGKLYFGGLNGLNGFYPEVLDSLTQLEKSPLVWTGFSKLDGSLDTIREYKENLLDSSKPLEIYDGDKSYSFRFALLQYENPQENTYSYFLEGYENDWNYVGNSSFANYPSLPEGEYRLRVKAKDSRGNSALNELSIPIVVYGPWWSTWWAIGIFIIIATAILVGYIRWRTTSLQRQKTILEKMVEERTIELAQEKERAELIGRFKEQFLANMSHEIRTPMHAISGMVKILDRNKHPRSQDVFLKAMQTSSDNLLVILNDILDHSKIEAGKLEVISIPMEPAAVLKNVIQVLTYKAEGKGLKFDLTIDPDIPEWVMGDPARLNQILINLAGNAIKFTEKGKISLSITRKNEFLIYKVKDTGIGIPEEKLSNIFEAFEQADESTNRHYGGTGLGLNISRQLVELQRGNIWAESEIGKGSTFFVSLPLIMADEVEQASQSLTEEEIQRMATALKGSRILLAEDNEFNQMIVQDDLAYYVEDIQIDIAENGSIAYKKYQTGGYNLVLMDVQMPEMDGYEATMKIRDWEKANSRSSIPIIAMTASVLKTEVNLCLEAGMDNYIPKPYKIEELIGRIYQEVKVGKS